MEKIILPEIPIVGKVAEPKGYFYEGKFRHELQIDGFCAEEKELYEYLFERMDKTLIIPEYVRRVNFECQRLEKNIKKVFSVKEKHFHWIKNVIIELRPEESRFVAEFLRKFPLCNQSQAEKEYHAAPASRIWCFLPPCDNDYVQWMFEYQDVHKSGYERPFNTQYDAVAPF